MLTLSTASASASICARRFSASFLQRINGGDAQYIAVQLAGQIVVLEHDVQRLIPRHVIEHDRQIAVDHGIEHNVQTADLVNQAEEIFQIHILKIDRDRLAGVLGPVHRRLLFHLDLLLSGQVHGRLDALRHCRQFARWRHWHWWRPVPPPSCRQSGLPLPGPSRPAERFCRL